MAGRRVALRGPRWAGALALVACTTNTAEQVDSAGGAAAGAAAAGVGVAQPVVIHRLTRFQYNNTVRDLLATNLAPADTFPADPVVGTYDNVAASLTISPQLAGLYHQAAHDLALDATRLKPRWGATVSGPAAGPHASPDGSALSNWGWQIRSPFAVPIAVPEDDTALLSIVAGGAATNAPTPQMQVAVDDQVVHTFTVSASTSQPATYSVQVPVAKGTRNLVITFTNKVTDNATTSNTDSELGIGEITLASQTLAPSPGLAVLMVCDPNQAPDPEACWRQVATTFVARAWRRPLSAEQSARVESLWQVLVAQSDHSLALTSLVQAALVSPNFLYLAARPGPAPAGGGTADLDAYDLASRLSYFLWGTMPDAALLAAAHAGALADPTGLATQVDRMLKDAKIQGLLDGFVGQWLATDALDSAAPDPAVFPAWNSQLKSAMQSEAKLFFADYLTNGQSIATMLTPDFAFLNDTLAAHYGLPPPGRADVGRVAVAADARRGLLAQGAWLTANSVQTRTSPVKRGRFILEHLLCRQVNPPPPGIAPLPSNMEGGQMTQRQLLDQHTTNPTCAGCHGVIDPPGFAEEIYDGIAASRTQDGNLPIDATGTLDGTAFDGAMQMAAIVAADPNFVACVARQLYTYALGRTVDDADQAPLEAIVAGAQGQTLDALIRQVVASPQFFSAPTS